MKAETNYDLDQKIKDTMDSWAPPTSRSLDQIWEEVAAKTVSKKDSDTPVITMKRQTNKWQLIQKYAIAAMLLLGLFYGTKVATDHHYQTSAQEFSSISLPDGSIVSMNPHTTLKYNDLLFRFKRTISFDGEGYFEIAKGSRFSIDVLKKGIVTITGTAFQIISNEHIFKTSCTEGSVIVSINGEKTTLIPGKFITNDGHRSVKGNINIGSNIKNRQKGLFEYENSPLNDVLFDLGNLYGVTINEDIAKDRYYTGFFNKDGLEDALQMVCEPMNMSYEIKNNQVILKNN